MVNNHPRMVTNYSKDGHQPSKIYHKEVYYRVYKKNAPLCFLYILAPIKATEIVFIWEETADPAVCFEYKTDSERCTVAEILGKNPV